MGIYNVRIRKSNSEEIAMTVYILQIIAMATMLCDHIAGLFLDDMVALRCIGRFAFPIYALLIAEGYRHIKHDKSRVTSHLGGYITLAVISEICYDFAESEALTVASFMESQNCIITLLLGFLGLMAIDYWKDKKKLYMWAAIALTAMLNFMVLSNYKFAGVLLIYAFYAYLNQFDGKTYMRRFVLLLAIFACYIPIYHWARCNFCGPAEYVEKLKGTLTWWYLTHIPIAALLATYTGKKGNAPKIFRTIYRYFYPGHLFILGIIRHLVFGI